MKRQHAYSISNINDDLTVPINAKPGFSDTNTWHSAISTTGIGLVHDVEADVLDFCDESAVWEGTPTSAYGSSTSPPLKPFPRHGGVLYAWKNGSKTLLSAYSLPVAVDPGWSSEGFVVPLDGLQVQMQIPLNLWWMTMEPGPVAWKSARRPTTTV